MVHLFHPFSVIQSCKKETKVVVGSFYYSSTFFLACLGWYHMIPDWNLPITGLTRCWLKASSVSVVHHELPESSRQVPPGLEVCTSLTSPHTQRRWTVYIVFSIYVVYLWCSILSIHRERESEKKKIYIYIYLFIYIYIIYIYFNIIIYIYIYCHFGCIRAHWSGLYFDARKGQMLRVAAAGVFLQETTLTHNKKRMRIKDMNTIQYYTIW